MVFGNIYTSRYWNGFRHEIKEITKKNTGFIPVEKTVLIDNRYGWSWTYPQLSVVWSQSCVRSILMNNPDVTWEPYDPRKTLILKDYVNYDRIFLKIDDNKEK